MRTNNTITPDARGAAPERRFIKAKQMGAMVGLCSKTIHRMAEAGLFAKYRVNSRVVLFDPDEVFSHIKTGKL